MIQKIKNFIFAGTAAFFLVLAVVPATAAADSACSNNKANANQQTCLNGNLCAGSNFNLQGNSTGTTTAPNDKTSSDCSQGTSTLSSKIKTILNLLSALIGILAVIMIIYAGFRYVTSAGSEGGIKAAKNAIIYAIIGLVVVALAQVIVHFVITNVT